MSLALLAAAAFLADPLFAEDTKTVAPVASATVAKNVSVDEAEKLLKDNPKIVVIDVRTADEFKEGHIPGAKNIDIMSDDFAAQIVALDTSKTYLIHCAAGGRSGRACKTPEVQQLKAVYHMNQGFGVWAKAGKPVEK